jgi:hypothetical protein
MKQNNCSKERTNDLIERDFCKNQGVQKIHTQD